MSDSNDWGVKLIKQFHFEKLKPLCPICRSNGQESFLEIRSVLKESNNSIIEGILICTNTQCLSEYPVIDGIPGSYDYCAKKTRFMNKENSNE